MARTESADTRRLNRDWAMGKAAYESYTQTTGDDDAWAWEDLATRLQDAWIAAAYAAWQQYEEI